ncbi:hypothetical protein ACTXT7_016698 [Hymenolepis weldensis]
MTLPVQRLVRAHGNSTFKQAAYIFCATLFICALFTGIIILYLVVLPYLHEHGFEESMCEVAEIEYEKPIIKCENRCSRERSWFPCLRVRVTFKRHNTNYSATLFDTIETHEHYRRYRTRLVEKLHIRMSFLTLISDVGRALRRIVWKSAEYVLQGGMRGCNYPKFYAPNLPAFSQLQ